MEIICGWWVWVTMPYPSPPQFVFAAEVSNSHATQTYILTRHPKHRNTRNTRDRMRGPAKMQTKMNHIFWRRKRIILNDYPHRDNLSAVISRMNARIREAIRWCLSADDSRHYCGRDQKSRCDRWHSEMPWLSLIWIKPWDVSIISTRSQKSWLRVLPMNLR